MIEKYVVLLLSLVAPFVSVSVFVESAYPSLLPPTIPRDVYSEMAILNDRLSTASIRDEIIFNCKAARTTDSEIFSVRPKEIIGFKALNTRFPLGLFVHGWEAYSENSLWTLDLLKTWSNAEYINVCIVDWSEIGQGGYAFAAWNVYDVGFTLASVIKSLESLGLFHRSKITIAGFSLGAHVAGYAGERLGGKVDHIIGLDPAGPLFTTPADMGPSYRLDETDGRFVQVIHTSSGKFGVKQKCGHADFYPNGGVTPQPNCFDFGFWERITCSHTTAIEYFTYSMDNHLPYVGYQCRSYEDFINGRCWSNPVGILGIHTNRLPGDFFLTTKAKPPYV